MGREDVQRFHDLQFFGSSGLANNGCVVPLDGM